MGQKKASTALVVVLTAFAMLVAACGGGGDDGDDVVRINYTFDWQPDGDWGPMLWAERNGYFEDEGLELDYVAGDGSSAALPLIAVGEMDMGQISLPPLVSSVGEQLPVTVVGVQQPDTPLVLLADADKEIREPTDLEGHSVAVQEGEFEGAVWAAFASATGLDRSQVDEQPAAGGADVLFIDKHVDAFMDFYTSGAMIELTDGRDGEETLFLMQDYLEIGGHSTVVNNTFREENPEAVRGFLRAFARGMKDMIDNPEETVDMILDMFPENDRTATEWSVARYGEFYQAEEAQQGGFLYFEPDLLESTKAVMVNAGLMEDDDIGQLYSTDYLPEDPIFP